MCQAGERSLLQRVFDAQEKSRQAIAHQIHEGIAQQLTAVRLQLRALEPLTQHSVAARDVIDRIEETLVEAIDQARNIVGRMRLPILREFGIVTGIEYLINEINRDESLEVAFIRPDALAPVDADVENAMFRIMQELLTNVRVHSRTRKLRVELAQHGDRLRVAVRDWGIGFDPAGVADDRFGLQEMAELARLLGGRLTVATAPGTGTTVVVELPQLQSSDRSKP